MDVTIVPRADWVAQWLGVPCGDAIEGDEVFHGVRWPIVVTEGESYRVYSESTWEVA